MVRSLVRASGALVVGAAIVWAASLAALPAAFAQDAVDSNPYAIHRMQAVVAADHQVASRVGAEILAAGGNAADAAVAVALTLGVVNNFASGIGGGGFAVVHDAASGETVALDFRETAPAASYREMYLDATRPEPARTGGLSIGVPGEVAGLWALHQRYGRLPWADLVEPARALAETGFVVEPLLVSRIAVLQDLAAFPVLRAMYSLGDTTVQPGDVLPRPGLARALAAIQQHGAEAFYQGPIAEAIVAAVQADGGILTLEDLAGYQPRWMTPTRIDWRGYSLYTMPLPSSGGVVMQTILGALEPWPIERLDWNDTQTTHVLVQAFAHAFADRAAHLGDPDFVEIDVAALSGEDRQARIREAFDPVRTLPTDAYGPRVQPVDDDGTAHFNVVDADGNAVAFTTTVNTLFGSKVVVEDWEIVLNNEMDDFASRPGEPNAFGLIASEANAPAPGKRPLSSMSPTLVFDQQGLLGALGGSGGPTIITGTLVTFLQLALWDRTAGEAVSSPRFHHQWLPETVTVEAAPDSLRDERLESYGYTLRRQSMWGAVQAIWRDAEGWQAACDPRKGGVPAGF